MGKRSVVGLLIVLVLGGTALVVRAATATSDVAEPLGVVVAIPVAPLAVGQTACQTPIEIDEPIAGVLFNPGTRAKRSPAADVLVRDLATHAVITRGVLPAGFDPARPQTVRFRPVSGPRAVAVCFRNRGPARLAIFGDATHLLCTLTARGRKAPSATCPPGTGAPTNSTSEAYVGGRDTGGDMSVTLLRPRARSLLDRLPMMVRRAALFRPGFVSPAMWWVLLACWALLAPGLLVVALRAISPPDDASAS